MQVTRLDTDLPWFEHPFERRPGKSVCIVRYGGFGDLIQSSSVFPWFKEQGYYIALNTTENGYEIIKHDPHIDEAILQETDQVPNHELGAYWGGMAAAFDKFVQFSESIEGALLALPGRPEYEWSTKKRHQRMNRDYFAEMHRIAGVPLPRRPKFYPSDEERKQAKAYRRMMGDESFVIMWALCGSSVHKAWPWTDQIVARLMVDHPNVKIIFVGDTLCQLLEDPWRMEKRIHRECGRMSIRGTLALSQQVDLVIGPETGVLNCVAFEDVPKIIMLSHSSPANIGNSWKNCVALTPRGVDCYPCHKMHFGFSTCQKYEHYEEHGGAMCAAHISPDRVYSSIKKHITRRLAA